MHRAVRRAASRLGERAPRQAFPATRLSLREPAAADVSRLPCAAACAEGNIRSPADRRV